MKGLLILGLILGGAWWLTKNKSGIDSIDSSTMAEIAVANAKAYHPGLTQSDLDYLTQALASVSAAQQQSALNSIKAGADPLAAIQGVVLGGAVDPVTGEFISNI